MTATTTTTRALSRTQKLLMSITAIGVTASMAGLGSFATFTDTESGSTPIDSGIVSMSVGADGTADNRMSVAATDIVPGDTIERAVKLTVDSTTTSTLGSIKLTTQAKKADGTVHSSKLDTDVTNGLQMLIKRCAVAWTEAGTAPGYTYTCPNDAAGASQETSVLASRAIIGADLDLSSALGLTAGTTNHLLVKVNLPTTADNTFQNVASTVTYSFTGTQRAATNK
ncbi:MAG: M73 family metallopeptidase [Actinobacteria bacterium]|nr:M73 family metallopeptidase [Actinomycetota bacterium]